MDRFNQSKSRRHPSPDSPDKPYPLTPYPIEPDPRDKRPSPIEPSIEPPLIRDYEFFPSCQSNWTDSLQAPDRLDTPIHSIPEHSRLRLKLRHKRSNVAELSTSVVEAGRSPADDKPESKIEKQTITGNEQPDAWRPGLRRLSSGDRVPKTAAGSTQVRADSVPFGNLDLEQFLPEETSSLAPPVSISGVYSVSQDREDKNRVISYNQGFQSTANIRSTKPSPGTMGADYYDVNKPTCSLNLVCYRSGQEGCKLQLLHCILRSKYRSQDAYSEAVAANPRLVASDCLFFCEMRRLYETEMCTFFRRYFSLKTLKKFRILAYTPTSRPTVVPFDGFVLQEIMYAYRNPHCLTGDEWIHWVFRLRCANKRHAVEFIEGWDSTRITIAAIFPLLSSCIVAIAWTVAGGDPQTTFTVASFILTCLSIILAVLAVVSSIKSFGNNDFN